MIIEKKIINNIKQKTKSKCGGCCGDTILTPTPSGSGGGNIPTPIPTATITPIPTSPTPTPTPSLTVSPSPTPSSSSGGTPIPTPTTTPYKCVSCDDINVLIAKRTYYATIKNKDQPVIKINYNDNSIYFSSNGPQCINLDIDEVYKDVLFVNDYYDYFTGGGMSGTKVGRTNPDNTSNYDSLYALHNGANFCRYCDQTSSYYLKDEHVTKYVLDLNERRICMKQYMYELNTYGINIPGNKLKTGVGFHNIDTLSVIKHATNKYTISFNFSPEILKTFDNLSIVNLSTIRYTMVIRFKLSNGYIAHLPIYLQLTGDRTYTGT